MAWLYSGYGDNATQYSRATVDIPFAAARLKDKMGRSHPRPRGCAGGLVQRVCGMGSKIDCERSRKKEKELTKKK